MNVMRASPENLHISAGNYEADLLIKAVEEAAARWPDATEVAVLRRFILPKLREAQARVVPRVKKKA